MAMQPLGGPGASRFQPQQPLQPNTARSPSPDEMKLKISNEPLSLVYRTAVQKLNELLAPEIGAAGLQGVASGGMDFSPEAVAERILSFATAGFTSFQTRHADQGRNEQLDGFMRLIHDAIDQGFAEARDILDGLGVLQGDISANTDRTYQLIQDGLGRFEEKARNSGPE
jgi:hypothetical protein